MAKAYIRSLGFYVPPKVVTNHDLEKLMDTNDEWIQQRSGIKERRWCVPGDTALDMSVKATNEALKKAHLSADDIDCIIYSALVSDYTFPGGGCLLQKELGGKRFIPAYDIRNACSGFLYALQMADSFIRLGIYKRVLIAASEIHSTSIKQSPEGRDVGVLFGDGAASTILEACDDNSKSGIIDVLVYSDGSGAPYLNLHRPSPSDYPRVSPNMKIDESYYPHMEGKVVFKNAVQRMCESMKEIFDKHKIQSQEIDFVIAHQANMRINQMVLNEVKIPWEKTHHTIDRYGNTTSVTIPITLNEAFELGKVKRGDLLAFTAFGAGFTWGSALLRF